MSIINILKNSIVVLSLMLSISSCKNSASISLTDDEYSDREASEGSNNDAEDDNTDTESIIEAADVDSPYIDIESGMQWSETTGSNLSAKGAYNFCKALKEKGLSGFILPTVEQLWTLVINCDNIVTCPDETDGRYSKFGDSGRFWSSSEKYIGDAGPVTKSPYPVPVFLDFNKLEIGWHQTFSEGAYSARCIREHDLPGKVRYDQPCSLLPINASWNTVDKIKQVWNGSKWLPSTDAKYNEEPSISECRFKCNEGYVGHDNACVTSEKAEKWSKSSPDKMTSEKAYEYCKNLEENGKADWRLPTISEMRSIVINCSSIESSGECNIWDNCLSYENCWNIKCAGCGEITDKRYSEFWDTNTFHTVSPNIDSWEKEYDLENDTADYLADTWIVDFELSRIMSSLSKYEYYVRCVR